MRRSGPGNSQLLLVRNYNDLTIAKASVNHYMCIDRITFCETIVRSCYYHDYDYFGGRFRGMPVCLYPSIYISIYLSDSLAALLIFNNNNNNDNNTGAAGGPGSIRLLTVFDMEYLFPFFVALSRPVILLSLPLL